MDSKQRNRKQMLIMFGIAALSIGISYLVFYGVQGGKLWGTVNNGEFVQPATQISELDFSFDDGNGFDTQGVWWLWVVSGASCQSSCADAVHQMRQLQVLLAKDANRVRRALVSPGLDPVGEQLRGQYPRLSLVQGAGIENISTGIYIVDPRGFLVLYYPLETAGHLVLEDLKRLLKVSQIG